MIGFIRGKPCQIGDTSSYIMIMSHEIGGIGYVVNTPYSDLLSETTDDSRCINLYIYTDVRENAIDLYGFKSHPERDLFMRLIAVKGFGPKTAITLMSKIAPNDIVRAIQLKDIATLITVPGIGKKVAQAVIDNFKYE